MADSGGLVLQVCPGAEDDAGELSELAGWLRTELLALDVQAVDPLSVDAVPPGAKGVAAVAGWLSVQLSGEVLRAVLTKVADWVIRNDREVEVSYGGDTLRLTKAHGQQQEKIIDAWCSWHAAGS